MGRRYDTVSLLTDFGYTDEFAGVLKAVIRDLAPHVTTIDLTHGIRPFDVRGGSLALARAISYVPEGVVVGVVDPGVGSDRGAVAIEVADGAGVLVGPDNGLLAPAVAVVGGATRAVRLADPAFHLGAPGATFAGRDVFAPVAAHLCNGADLADLGPALDPAGLFPGLVPLPRHDDDGLHAEVVWVDHFGNCELNVGPEELAALGVDTGAAARGGAVVTAIVDGERRPAHLARSYAELRTGTLGLVLDSQGMYALSMNQRSAAADVGLAAGDAVTLVADDDPTALDAGSPPVAVELGRRSPPSAG